MKRCSILHAIEPEMKGYLQDSLDTSENPMLASLWPGEKFKELLDYVFVSNSNQGKRPQPHEMHCDILKPQWPKDCMQQNGPNKKCMLSDHFPNSCTFESSATKTLKETH